MEAHPPLMLCDYLASKSGPAQAFPSRLNRCNAEGQLGKLPLDKQSELCLGPGHRHCPLWLKAKTREYSPPLSAAEALPTGQRDKAIAGEYRTGKKHRENRPPEKVEELPDSSEFEQTGGEFDAANSEKSRPAEHKPAKNEPVSQPFRHELDDWMRGLFKDLRGK
jgi:hypothetical protein